MYKQIYNRLHSAVLASSRVYKDLFVNLININELDNNQFQNNGLWLQEI